MDYARRDVGVSCGESAFVRAFHDGRCFCEGAKAPRREGARTIFSDKSKIVLAFGLIIPYIKSSQADMAQLVEHNLAKVGVAGSSPVVRSIWAFSSGGERFPDTEEVTSSNLVTPTKCSQPRGFASGLFCFTPTSHAAKSAAAMLAATTAERACRSHSSGSASTATSRSSTIFWILLA